MNLENLKKEAAALGLKWVTIFNGQPVIDGDERIKALLFACQEKKDGDPEIAELRQYLGSTDPRWVAYVKVRGETVARRRQYKYSQINGILLGAIADATVAFTGDGYMITLPKREFDEWRAEVRRIKEEEPYEVNP